MILPRWHNLSESDRAVFQAAAPFMKGRLTDHRTIIWSLRLKPNEAALRAAVLTEYDRAIDGGLPEPWHSAWQLIEETWQEPLVPRHDRHVAAIGILERVKRGHHSGAVIRQIVDLVHPRLSVEPGRLIETRGRRWRPKSFRDLVQPGLTSGEYQSVTRLGLDRVEDVTFLAEVARSLDAAAHQGLQAAGRFGWDGKTLYGLGSLDRVENTASGDDTDRDQTDEFHQGIAPSVKLLHGVVTRLVELDVAAARGLIEGFRRANTIVHDRLWSSFARDPRFADIDQVAAHLTGLSDRAFWYLHTYPEVAALRAARFGELSGQSQAALVERLLGGPPRSFWPRNIEHDRFQDIRAYWTVRELRRIQNAGHLLPDRAALWLASRLTKFEDLAVSADLNEGFPGASVAFDIAAPSDDMYDLLSGLERIQRLEHALRTKQEGWGQNPSDAAANWIARLENAALLIADFESLSGGQRDFPEVWERFGWRHSPSSPSSPDKRDLADEARRVLSLLATLGDETLEGAVEGLSDWLNDWRNQIARLPQFVEVWNRLWPLAQTKTDSEQPPEEEPRLDVVVGSSEDAEPRDLDTYNTAAGKMAGAFLATCPNLGELGGAAAFPPDAPQTLIRDALIQADGRSGLVVKHRLIEGLAYFMGADAAWTEAHLIPALSDSSETSLPLWNAVVRRQLSPEVVRILGPFMLLRAADSRLPRKTRQGLAFRCCVECLVAHWKGREPAITSGDMQGMLRAVSDDVRAFAAETPQRFVRDVSVADKVAVEELFAKGVVPFLEHDWPQERSLATPGTSHAFADLPATVGERFADAVAAIERYLVPFECWSMNDYGLYGDDGQQVPRLAMINDAAKASALLLLLDKTVGAAPGSIVPSDLSAALQQIRGAAPQLVGTPSFRRLATAARL